MNKRISRAQLSVLVKDKAVEVELLGANPSLINDVRLEKGQKYTLKPGDVLKLLPDFAFFKLQIEIQPEVSPPASSKRKLSDSDGSLLEAPEKKAKPEEAKPVVVVPDPTDGNKLARARA